MSIKLLSDRLELKSLEMGDAAEMLKIRSHPEINRYISRTPPGDISEIESFIQRIHLLEAAGSTLFWTIRLKHTDNILGTICLWNINKEKMKAEVGYELLPKYQGMGYMSEALAVVLNAGFDEFSFEEISAYTNRQNEASVRLLEKMEFVHDPGIIDEDFPSNDVYIKRKKQ